MGKIKVGKEQLDYLARNMPGSTYGRTKIYHKVQSGDVLGKIAQQYNVRVTDIKSWNGLSSNTIRIGQRLSIWVLPAYSSATKDLYASANTNGSKTIPAAIDPLDPNQKIYRVQNGDTLWDISRKANVSIEKLKELNKLSNNTIHPGQQLILGTE